jgi:hypothetical protein
LDQLINELGFEGNLATFRVLCWTYEIDYKKKRSMDEYYKRLFQLDTKKLTLTQIKEAIRYKSSINSLKKILHELKLNFKRKENKNNSLKETVLKKTKEIDTRLFTPQQIIDIVGVEMVNPASYLRTINIPYKPKNKKGESKCFNTTASNTNI